MQEIDQVKNLSAVPPTRPAAAALECHGYDARRSHLQASMV